MSSDLASFTLSEYCSEVKDGTHDSPKKQTKGKLLVTSKNIKNSRLDKSSAYNISISDFDAVNKRSKVDRHDVLLSMIGTVGEACIVNEEPDFAIKNVGLLKCKNEVQAYWLYYYLRTPLAQLKIKERLRGTTQQYLPLGEIRKFPISYPKDDAIARKTVSILRSLDNKIELNRQTNQTLEKMAQAVFTSWFVDFEPTRAKIKAIQNGQDPTHAAMAAIAGKTVDQLDTLSSEQTETLAATADLFPETLMSSELGEIPDGWEVTELGDILEFNPRRTLKKGTLAPYLDMKNVPTKGHLAGEVYMREMASGTKFINGDTLLARITPCLENGKTSYVDFIEGEQVAWGSTEYIVMRPKDARPLSLGYFIARQDSFRAKAIQTMTGTSGRQRANAKALSEQAWIDYPRNLLDEFDLLAGTYLEKAKAHGDQNNSLSELRDTLLPKLLSGEINISNLNGAEK